MNDAQDGLNAVSDILDDYFRGDKSATETVNQIAYITGLYGRGK